MKLIAFIVLYTLAAAVKAGLTTEEAKEAIRTISADCVRETGATEADVEVMMKHLPAQNTETKCLIACVMKKLDVMTVDGKFDANVGLKLAEAHTHGDVKKMQIAEAVTNACKDIVVPDDHCEAADSYQTCLQTEALKHGVDMNE